MVEGLNAFVAFLKEEGVSQETLSFFEAAMSQVVHLFQVAKLKDDAAGALVKRPYPVLTLRREILFLGWRNCLR
jgi:hypothetical protein